MRFRQVIQLTRVHAQARYDRTDHDIASLGSVRFDGTTVTIDDLVRLKLRGEFRAWIELHVPSARFTWCGYNTPHRDMHSRGQVDPFVEMIIHDEHEAFAYHMRWRGVTIPPEGE